MAKHKQQTFIKGTASHRRTEGDYMGVLLDTVTLDDWRDVVAGALNSAKEGDPQARAWLAQYLVGKPETKAPTPLTVLVQQLNDADPIAERLAKPIIDRALYPILHEDDDWKDSIRALVVAELAEKVTNDKTSVTPEPARLTGQSGD